MLGSLVLRLRAGKHCQCQLLRSLVTQTTAQSPADAAVRQVPQADQQTNGSGAPSGRPQPPAWWSDPQVNAQGAYRIIKKRLATHGSQREENYRQLFNRIKTPKDAALGLEILRSGRAARAVLQQHIPFTFHTSQHFITTCNAVKAFDTALQSLEQGHELGLQFFRADAYYSTMKAAALDGRLDIAIKVFETMKENGVRPGGKVVHNLIMGSIINGRKDLAEAYAEEFRLNGVKINAASQAWLDGTRHPTSNDRANEPADEEADVENADQKAVEPQATAASAVTSA